MVYMSPLCKPRCEVGTPLLRDSVKIVLLGSGELGKEVAIEAQRLGVEVVAVDRYDMAPAMHVSHRKYVVNMLNGNALKAIIRRENPDVVVPEVEAIDTNALIELEEEGYFIIPNAKAVKISMDRILLRKLAVEEVGVKTTRYGFASSIDDVRDVCERIGYPCIVKAQMSSSGHGSAIINSYKDIDSAYEHAIRGARGKSEMVIVEEYLKLDTELTVLTVRSFNNGSITTWTFEPVEHKRPGFHYHESWQPAKVSSNIKDKACRIARGIVERLGGLGVFGCELLVSNNEVYFNEVSPRPHDTGMVTMMSQDLSEFAVHVRAILGLPIPEVKVLTAAAAHVILAHKDNVWAPKYSILEALKIPGVNIRLFGKPVTYPERRMGIVLARGVTIDEARVKAEKAAHIIEDSLR